jgi:hypothetical protein
MNSPSGHLAQAQGAPGGRPDARFPDLSAVRQQVGVNGILASVVATVNLTTGSGTIAFVYPVSGLPVSGMSREGAVIIRATSSDQTVLDEFPVQVKLNSELAPGDEQRGLADAVLPVRAETQALDLVIAGQVADSFRVAGPPPTVRAIQPIITPDRQFHVGLEFDRELEEGHNYAVQISSDNGQTWQTAGIGLKDKMFTIDRSQYRDGQEIRIRIMTSNGISASVVTSAPFRISNPSASSQ